MEVIKEGADTGVGGEASNEEVSENIWKRPGFHTETLVPADL